MSAQASMSITTSSLYQSILDQCIQSRQVNGTDVMERWIPYDLWPRFAHQFESTLDLKQFREVCSAARNAVDEIQLPHLYQVTSQFIPRMFFLPDSITNNILMIHVVPPHADSIILFLDDSESGNGVDLAWLSAGRLQRIALGLDSVPASSVSNICFAPDGSRIALLVTLAHGALVHEDGDPLHRLRGWEKTKTDGLKVYDITHKPCEDCTVQVIDFKRDEFGLPRELVLHTFSHVFVPEYGFDMVWRKNDIEHQFELAFTALLHASSGAALYLVRWISFICPHQNNFVFMACVDGASSVFLQDKQKAMLSSPQTKCTSRVEIALDAKSVFFDTESKFGILKFDQVVDPSSCQVTRADLPKSRFSTKEERIPLSPDTDRMNRRKDSSAERKLFRKNSRSSWPREGGKLLGKMNGGKSFVRKVTDEIARVSRMSPDGMLMCSILGVSTNHCGSVRRHTRRLEMRSSKSGLVIYRKQILQRSETLERLKPEEMDFEISNDVAQHTLSFSSNSALLLLWDTILTNTNVKTWQKLPIIIDAKTGELVQDFQKLSEGIIYDHIQAAPDALTLYGTRIREGRVSMDAIDTLSGRVIKTVVLGGPLATSVGFSGHSVFVVSNRVIYAVSRGCVDVLRETTRGTLGCAWIWKERDTDDQSSAV